jgi:5-methylcytosine-specific restriction endonuclease McrA
MKLTKTQREQLRMMFDGRCAYCGEPLPERWHADHVAAVERKLQYVRGKGFLATGELYKPENDRIENMMPACPPCNIDKHSMPLDGWRKKLQGATGVLNRNNPTYRHAKRFGLLSETSALVTFYFERVSADSAGRDKP